jgi:hypothetical protein
MEAFRISGVEMVSELKYNPFNQTECPWSFNVTTVVYSHRVSEIVIPNTHITCLLCIRTCSMDWENYGLAHAFKKCMDQ